MDVSGQNHHVAETVRDVEDEEGTVDVGRVNGVKGVETWGLERASKATRSTV